MRQRLRHLSERAMAAPVLGPALRLLREMLAAFRLDRVTGLAAEIAFFALLSLFPTLLVLASVLGLLDSIVGDDLADRAERAVIEMLEEVLTEEGEGLIEAVERLFNEPAPGLLSIGLVLTLWTASRGFTAVTNALDVVYDFHNRRSWLQARLLGLALTLGTLLVVAVLLAMVLVGPLLGGGEELADRWGFGEAFATLWYWLRLPVVALVLVLWAATLYHAAPSQHTKWRYDVPGALLAAGGWALVTVGFRVYVQTAGAETAAGTVGAVLIAVLWMYAMGIVLLVGGELNAILEGRRQHVAETLEAIEVAVASETTTAPPAKGDDDRRAASGDPPDAEPDVTVDRVVADDPSGVAGDGPSHTRAEEPAERPPPVTDVTAERPGGTS